MRLLAWNAQCASRTKRSFSDILELVLPLHPDVLLVSEGPADSSTASWSWGNPAPARLSVWTSPEFAVVGVDSRPDVPQTAVLQLSGRVDFTLAALWPVEIPDGLSYAGILERALESYPAIQRRDRLIFAGDLNSSSGVVKQRASHPRLVAALKDRGLTSLHHHQEGVAHGDERTGTYRWDGKEYHLDYAFVSDDLLGEASVAIPRNEKWAAVSDHYPLVVDIPDAAFRERGF